MFKIIIPILVIALAAFVGMNAKSGLIRGVADGMLVSPARPAVAVKPAADFASVDARRVDLSPSVQNSMLQATSVQAVYALYNHEGPQAAPAHFVALLAVSQNDETWPVEPDLGFPAIRHKKQDIDGFSGFADTYVLDAKDDPWASDEPALWENGSLVRRFTFILWFYKAKLIVEYREPLPAPSDMPLEDNIPLLTAFEARALESFRLLNGDPHALRQYQGDEGKRHADRRAESGTHQGGDGTARARLGEKSGHHGRRHRRGGYGQLGRGRRNGYPEASAREVASRLPQGAGSG